MPTPRKLLSYCITMAASWALPGCAGVLDDPGRFADAGGNDSSLEATTGRDVVDTFDGGCPVAMANAIPKTLFATTCAATGCHNPTDLAGSLDLQSANLASRLVGVQAHDGPGQYVTANGNPSTSVLYLMLTPSFPFDNQMPLGGPPFLDDPTLACVREWVVLQGPHDAGGPDAPSTGDSALDAVVDAVGDGGADVQTQ